MAAPSVFIGQAGRRFLDVGHASQLYLVVALA